MRLPNETTHILFVRQCEAVHSLTEEMLAMIPNQPYFITPYTSLAKAENYLKNDLTPVVLIEEECLNAEELEAWVCGSQNDNASFIILVNQAENIHDCYFVPPGQERFHYLLKSELTPHLLDFTIREVLDHQRLRRIVNEKECRINLLLKTLQHRLKPSVFAEHLVLEQLMEGTFGSLSQPQQSMVLELIKSNRNTSLLIENIEEFQHPEVVPRKYTAEAVNVNQLIRHLVEKEYSNKIKEKQHQVTLQLDEKLASYPCRIHKLDQAFRNLIQNAVLYTQKKGTIEIQTVLESETKWVFSIKDNGPGIPESILPLLFDPCKSQANNRLWNGNGLGLYTTREIIQANDGEFDFVSAPEEGSSFRVSFSFK